jgi:hypothetical protein
MCSANVLFSVEKQITVMNIEYAVSLAGGVGSRFWPVESKQSFPKQFTICWDCRKYLQPFDKC